MTDRDYENTPIRKGIKLQRRVTHPLEFEEEVEEDAEPVTGNPAVRMSEEELDDLEAEKALRNVFRSIVDKGLSPEEMKREFDSVLAQIFAPHGGSEHMTNTRSPGMGDSTIQAKPGRGGSNVESPHDLNKPEHQSLDVRGTYSRTGHTGGYAGNSPPTISASPGQSGQSGRGFVDSSTGYEMPTKGYVQNPGYKTGGKYDSRVFLTRQSRYLPHPGEVSKGFGDAIVQLYKGTESGHKVVRDENIEAELNEAEADYQGDQRLPTGGDTALTPGEVIGRDEIKKAHPSYVRYKKTHPGAE